MVAHFPELSEEDKDSISKMVAHFPELSEEDKDSISKHQVKTQKSI
jgi:hypothetical protein